ncbi:hypothetical protein EHS19_10390 [Bifidobacterium jacchi]|uniref:Uncharacterized protein n=1 Tax=Bifidobacterium jacchi TaxID=2490545 RepID=A0A5N5RC68_9BIFI|nr:hypothetical protein EHS19_10390 [Bifidobacterium jacchi]
MGVVTTLAHKYDGTGFVTANFWEAQWNKKVANKKYHNNNKEYDTNDAFSDDPAWSVDKLAANAWNNTVPMPPVVIVIALNQSEPASTPPQKYKLTVSTKASGRFGTSGGTNPVTDAITLNNTTAGRKSSDRSPSPPSRWTARRM